jgi:hypothetical protein
MCKHVNGKQSWATRWETSWETSGSTVRNTVGDKLPRSQLPAVSPTSSPSLSRTVSICPPSPTLTPTLFQSCLPPYLPEPWNLGISHLVFTVSSALFATLSSTQRPTSQQQNDVGLLAFSPAVFPTVSPACNLEPCLQRFLTPCSLEAGRYLDLSPPSACMWTAVAESQGLPVVGRLCCTCVTVVSRMFPNCVP